MIENKRCATDILRMGQFDLTNLTTFKKVCVCLFLI